MTTMEVPTATLLEQYVEATREKKRLKAESDKAGKRATELEEQLLEQFAAEGVRAKSTEDATVSVNRRLWARPVGGVAGRAAAAKALQESGLGELVHLDFNVTTLTSFFNEQITAAEDAGEPVTDLDALLAEHYPGLVGAIALTQDHKLGVTKR